MKRTLHPKKRRSRIFLTEGMRQALYAERQRTGVSVPSLARNHLDQSLGITPRKIHQWMLGIIKSADPERYDAVLRAWTMLPAKDTACIHYSPEVKSLMETERRRTGVPVHQVLSHDASPSRATANRLRNFYDGRLTKLTTTEFDRLMTAWRSLPDTTSETITLTPEVLNTLKDAIMRTNMGPHAVLRNAKDKPEGLRAAIVATWLSGKTRSARKDHLTYLLERYETAESASPKRGRPLSSKTDPACTRPVD